MWDQDPHMLARGAQRLGEGEAAAECVAVGVLVTEDQDFRVGVEELRWLSLLLLGPLRRLAGGKDFLEQLADVNGVLDRGVKLESQLG